MNFDNDNGTDGYPYPPRYRGPTPNEPLNRTKWLAVTLVVLITAYFFAGL